ncbi:tRNA (adenosine(37)-N6)-threonylcarbamoyltransferase complex ATPase subunit type 1 TsaE [Effusibacillus dendaii]|uniref:tRNA threonylcarbamoyladenosine biosynthesis protein TsaE n=1 Tax=Effusibacillus dendaii TaxID=2743772 RepID=A0A7I8DD32_9BACL|nr:tRNA (adenosine(37)-N6)-threonylcarbamoyltransferase complex ATPase subunit type 1 TsaE [Effusibacillus dendaii]
MFQRITHTPEETKQIAKTLAELLGAGDVLTLAGDLGAGKTTFTQGLASGLGIEEAVSSPTFTLIREYEGRIPLYHIDVYRLGEQAGGENLGWDEYFYGNGVTVVEWADFIKNWLPDEWLQIEIQKTGDLERTIHISGVGERFQRMVKELDDRCPI